MGRLPGGGRLAATVRRVLAQARCPLLPPAPRFLPAPLVSPQGYDLLEQHLGQADLDIVHLEAEVSTRPFVRSTFVRLLQV